VNISSGSSGFTPALVRFVFHGCKFTFINITLCKAAHLYSSFLPFSKIIELFFCSQSYTLQASNIPIRILHNAAMIFNSAGKL